MNQWVRRGNDAHSRKDYARMERCFHKAVEEEPGNAMVWSAFGQMFYKQEDYPRAEECSRKALEIAPKDRYDWISLGASLHMQGDYAGAEACYRKGLEFDQNSWMAWNNLGEALQHGKKDLAGAKQCYRKALSIYPENKDIQKNLASLQEEGKPKRALRQTLLNHEPQKPDAQRIVADDIVPFQERLEAVLDAGLLPQFFAHKDLGAHISGMDPVDWDSEYRGEDGADVEELIFYLYEHPTAFAAVVDYFLALPTPSQTLLAIVAWERQERAPEIDQYVLAHGDDHILSILARNWWTGSEVLRELAKHPDPNVWVPALGNRNFPDEERTDAIRGRTLKQAVIDPGVDLSDEFLYFLDNIFFGDRWGWDQSNDGIGCPSSLYNVLDGDPTWCQFCFTDVEVFQAMEGQHGVQIAELALSSPESTPEVLAMARETLKSSQRQITRRHRAPS